jgi:two-component system, LytTR family, sensor kinase
MSNNKWHITNLEYALRVLITLLFPAVVITYVLFGERIWHEWRIWYICIPISLVISFLSGLVHDWHEKRVQRLYPEIRDSPKRIFHKVLIMLTFMPIVNQVFLFLMHHYSVLGYQWQLMHSLKVFFLVLTWDLIFKTWYEWDYITKRYQATKAEREMLAELSISQELDALKNQINPHFLFNCFNTLSSLITIDKERAEAFLNELSKVYRYLLRSNAEDTSTLKNEVQFIESYFKLLQTRHGDAVRLNIQVNKEYENYLLPSLSLQLLVENAVTHNMMSKNKPLSIDIFTTAGNQLVVNNNLQRRLVKALSNRVGLENIRYKYELLRQPGFQVMEDEKNYTVVLPLIWKGN